MEQPPLIPIAREGQEIGEWSGLEIRQLLVSGQLRPTDHYFDEESQTWSTLLPSPKRRTLHFDWESEGDEMSYYIKDGFVHGPRTPEEITTLHTNGFLPPDTPISFIGADTWYTYIELVPSHGDVEHLHAAKRQTKARQPSQRSHQLRSIRPFRARKTGRFHRLCQTSKSTAKATELT